jgi:YidC/Oxa1 family membrane protein insertase
LIAIYRVFFSGIKSEHLDALYSFIANPGTLNPIAFGFLDLSSPNIILAILAGAAQFVQAKMMVSKRAPEPKGVVLKGAKDENMLANMNKQMTYFMPIVTIIIGVSLPAGLTLYWFLTTLLMALQQYLIFTADKRKKAKEVSAIPENVAIPDSVKEGEFEEVEKSS